MVKKMTDSQIRAREELFDGKSRKSVKVQPAELTEDEVVEYEGEPTPFQRAFAFLEDLHLKLLPPNAVADIADFKHPHLIVFSWEMIFVGVFIYYMVTNTMSINSFEFLSLTNPKEQYSCIEVPVVVFGSVQADTQGYWQTDAKYTPDDAFYQFSFQGSNVTTADFRESIAGLSGVNSAVRKINTKSVEADLTFSLIALSSFASSDPKTSISLTLNANADVIFNQPILGSIVSSSLGLCKQPTKTSYESSTSTFIVAITTTPNPIPGGYPTAFPTIYPTHSPSSQPTPAPSALPTAPTPTAEPTARPTKLPTELPTELPTVEPTVTDPYQGYDSVLDGISYGVENVASVNAPESAKAKDPDPPICTAQLDVADFFYDSNKEDSTLKLKFDIRTAATAIAANWGLIAKKELMRVVPQATPTMKTTAEGGYYTFSFYPGMQPMYCLDATDTGKGSVAQPVGRLTCYLNTRSVLFYPVITSSNFNWTKSPVKELHESCSCESTKSKKTRARYLCNVFSQMISFIFFKQDRSKGFAKTLSFGKKMQGIIGQQPKMDFGVDGLRNFTSRVFWPHWYALAATQFFNIPAPRVQEDQETDTFFSDSFNKWETMCNDDCSMLSILVENTNQDGFYPVNLNGKTLPSFVSKKTNSSSSLSKGGVTLKVYLPVCQPYFWTEDVPKRLPKAAPPVRLVERYLICHKTFWNSLQEAISLSAATASLYASTAIIVIMLVIVNVLETGIKSPAAKQEQTTLHTRECLRILKKRIMAGYFDEKEAAHYDNLVEAAFPHHDEKPVETHHAEKAAQFKRDVRQRRASKL